MKRLILLLVGFMPLSLFAQFEVGVMVGISNYQGDLSAETISASLEQTHAAYGGFLRYNFSNYLTARLSLMSATISGDDASGGSESRRQRNLSFRNRLFEVGLTGEFNILGYQPYNLERIFSPYIFAGIAFTSHNPRAFIDGDWVELQPLGTEGQGLSSNPDTELYSKSIISIPFGGGVKYAINDKWNLGLEAGIRYTFTDYLDDVSTIYPDQVELTAARGELASQLSNRTGSEITAGSRRGNDSNRDWYFIGGLTISYNFADNGLVGSRNRSRRKSGCPTF
ncbi:MAG: DUF6089 family protein [Bacteroidota bacterium]